MCATLPTALHNAVIESENNPGQMWNISVWFLSGPVAFFLFAVKIEESMRCLKEGSNSNVWSETIYVVSRGGWRYSMKRVNASGSTFERTTSGWLAILSSVFVMLHSVEGSSLYSSSKSLSIKFCLLCLKVFLILRSSFRASALLCESFERSRRVLFFALLSRYFDHPGRYLRGFGICMEDHVERELQHWGVEKESPKMHGLNMSLVVG